MEYRQLGRTDLNVSVVGFGGWALGGRMWGRVDERDAMAAVERALDLGVNLFDTAPIYGFGRSEELLGRVFGRRRHGVVIATKCGLEWDRKERIKVNLSRERVLAECDDSLRRLKTDSIDLYQMHWPDPETPLEETLGALEELRAAGKVRHIACSNFNVTQMQQGAPHLVSLQAPYNVLRRGIATRELAFCRRENLGVLAYEPLCRGLLTGKFRGHEKFAADDLRNKDVRFQGRHFTRNVEIVVQLKALAARRRHSVAELAIAWVLSQPGVTCALAGAKKPAQIEESASAAGWTLSSADLAAIDKIVGKDDDQQH